MLICGDQIQTTGTTYWIMLVIRFVSLSLLALTSPASGLRGSWNQIGDYEYRVSLPGEIKSYSEAQTYCQSLGLKGELTFVKNALVQRMVEQDVSSYRGNPVAFYIGLYDENFDQIFYWNDGESLNYTNWNTGEPGNEIPDEKCVTMGHNSNYVVSLKWFNQVCDKGDTGYVCQRKRGRGTWNALGGYEYYVSLPYFNVNNYDHAQSLCNSHGGELAFAKTQEIQEFIQTLIYDNGYTGNNINYPYAFYIGLRDIENNGTYFWNDDEVLNYDHWISTYPLRYAGNCVIMGERSVYTLERQWQNYDCTNSAFVGLVCQRANAQITTTTTTVTTASSARNSQTTTIIAAVMGVLGVLVFLFIIFIVFTYLRRRQDRQKLEEDRQRIDRNYVNIGRDITVNPNSLQAESGQVNTSFINDENNYEHIGVPGDVTYASISHPGGNYETINAFNERIPSEENDGEYNTFNRNCPNTANGMKGIAKGTSSVTSNSAYCTTEAEGGAKYSRISINSANEREVDATYNTLNEPNRGTPDDTYNHTHDRKAVQEPSRNTILNDGKTENPLYSVVKKH